MIYKPKRILFEKKALEYPLGERVYKWAKENDVYTEIFSNSVRYKANEKLCPPEQFSEAKSTLAVTVKKGLKFETCKPSADYQLPLVTGCPGFCQYCYLFTNLGTKPYLRIYANIDEILAQADKYSEDNKDKITVFEGAATSDPLPIEPMTGALELAIEHFAEKEHARFKFVSKFSNVDSLLNLKHNGHTFIRFSINADNIISAYEKGTPRLEERLKAAAKVAKAGYPIGFIIAPIFIFDGWQLAYRELFVKTKEHLSFVKDLPIELITHRFTTRAKQNILSLFPDTTLPMEEESRKYKFGQFGYGKYVYQPEDFHEIKNYFEDLIPKYNPAAHIQYFV